MKDNSFYNKIHRLGRITVVCALISFMAVPFGLAAVNGISMNIPEILKNAIPLLLTFSISGICENLSFMPIIGSGALYMSCVTGNVSNMKVPAAVNAMEVAGYTAGSDRADVVAIIAVAASTFVTTAIVFLGMLFLAPLFEPIYNNAFLQPAFQNMVPALVPVHLKGPEAGHHSDRASDHRNLSDRPQGVLFKPELYYGRCDHFVGDLLSGTL